MGKAASIPSEQVEYHKVLIDDPLAFCDIACAGFKPNRGQERFIRADLHRQKSLIVAGRRFGKTYGLCRKVCWDLFRLPGCKIFLFCPSETQSTILFDDACQIYKHSPYLSRFVQSSHKGSTLYVHEGKYRSKLQLIKVGLDASKARGHGVGKCGYVIGDEILAHYDPRQVTSVIEPFILEAQGNGGLVYLSSPGEAMPGDFFYDRYVDWSAQEKAALEDGRTPRHRVYRITYEDVDHIDKQEIEDKRRECEREGRLWWWQREYLGEFTISSGQYFNGHHIQQCSNPVPPIENGGRLDTWVWSFDPGGRRSPAVLQIARYNQVLNRLEVVHVASFIFADKYQADCGHERIHEYADIDDAVIDLKSKYPPHTVYVDPQCEKSMTERWKNALRLNVIDDKVGGYNQKTQRLGDLERALQDQRIVWTDRRITEQLLRFAPPRNKVTGRFEFPDTEFDFIITAAMLCRFLGDREVIPFACAAGKRPEGERFSVW